MKKILSILLFLCSVHVFAQNYSITGINISMPANSDANTANWGQGASPFTISAKTTLDSNRQVQGYVMESLILVTIKKGGSKICGTYTATSAPASSFNTAVKVWNGRNAVSLLGQDCVLPPGDYELCVQFFGSYNGSAKAFSEEKCKPFTIRGTAVPNDITYQPPQNVSPADGAVIKEADAKKPVTFRWTPVVPKPQGPQRYTVNVWEVPAGKNINEVVKSQQPIFTKSVLNQTQLVSNEMPALMAKGNPLLSAPTTSGGTVPHAFAWNVTATSENGTLLGSSGVTSFSIAQNDIDTQIDSLKVGCCINGKQSIYIKIKNNLSNANTILKKIWIMGVNGNTGSPYPFDISSSFVPSLPFSFLPANGTKVFTGSIDCIQNMSTIIVKTECERNVTGLNVSDYDLDYDTLSCRCNTCDQVQWQTPELIKYDTSLFRGTNNIMTLYGNINFGPQKIVKLSAELVDFYWYTEGDCKKCNSNDYYFGNMVSATATGLTATSVADESGIPLASSHQIDFVSPTLSGVALNTPIALNISLPPQTQLICCTDCFRFCIRYTATFMENGVCKTCSIVKCYESKRTHRKNGLQQWPQPNQCGDVVIPPHGGGGVLINATKQ